MEGISFSHNGLSTTCETMELMTAKATGVRDSMRLNNNEKNFSELRCSGARVVPISTSQVAVNSLSRGPFLSVKMITLSFFLTSFAILRSKMGAPVRDI